VSIVPVWARAPRGQLAEYRLVSANPVPLGLHRVTQQR
jgi:hypothetical protein